MNVLWLVNSPVVRQTINIHCHNCDTYHAAQGNCVLLDYGSICLVVYIDSYTSDFMFHKSYEFSKVCENLMS